MKKPYLLLALLLSSGLYAQTTPMFGIRSKNSNYKAFTNATIVVSPTRTLTNATMIVRDGRVVSVGENLPVPNGAFEYNCKGMTIYPGFVDPYTEYGLKSVGRLNAKKDGQSPKYEGTRSGADAWNDAIHAERNWIESFKPDKDESEKFLSQGITVVQSGKMDGIFRGRSFVTDLSDDLANNAVLRPYSLHFGSYNKGTSEQEYPSSLMGSIALIRQTFMDAEWYTKARSAYQKNSAQSMPEFNVAIAALAENRDPIVFESEDELSALRTARWAQEFRVPLIHVGNNFEYARLDEIAALRQPIILPVVFPKRPNVTTIDDELDVSLADLRHWERAPYNAVELMRKNVTFAFTSNGLKDRGDFLKNVRETVSRGVTPQAALTALTTAPAQLCGVAGEVGTLEQGKLANFFIANGDIFSDTVSIFSVWIRGGQAKELATMTQHDFRGEYALQLNGTSLTASIKGKKASPSGELKVGDKKAKLDNVSISYDQLFFSTQTDSFGIPGITRFSITKVNSTYAGAASTTAGTMLSATASRTAEYVQEADTTKKEKEEPDTVLISKTTYPNLAFGYTEIPKAENVLVRGATLWTCDNEGTLENTDMLVTNGKISRIGQNLTAPAGTKIIDAAGKHVTAGIIDEHSHIAISRNVNEGSNAVTAEVRIGDVVNSDDINMYRALAGGVTAAQLLHGSANPIGGQAQVIKMRWGYTPENMKLAGTPASIKFALGENVKQSNWGDDNTTRYPQTRMGVESIIRDGFQAAREYEADWKAYNALGKEAQSKTIPPRRDIQIEALLDIMNSKMFIHCHSYVQSEILMLMRLAEQMGFKVQTFTHILEGYKVADEMAAHGASASSFSDWWAYKFEVYDAIPYNTCLMHERGVLTCINSDSPEMGRRLNQEAGKSVMYCGIPEAEAIKFATLNPAKMLKIDDKVGSLKAGKDADFVIWSHNPLSMYARAEQTWVDGICFFSLEKDAQLRAENRAERVALIQKALKSKSSGGGPSYTLAKGEEIYDCETIIDIWEAINNAHK